MCASEHGPLPCQRWVGLPEGRVDVLQALQQALLSRDALRVARIVAAAQGSVSLNANRAAVQVMGCGGGIVAHMPVSRDFLDLVRRTSVSVN